MSVPISVIVPSYNRASYIGETIESILNQSLSPAEVVIVDDGSTDETESVLQGFGDKVRWHRIENSGPCVARNVGVGLSTSPLIAFCDSDDLWAREKLEKQAALHQRNGIECSFTNFRIVSDGAWRDQTKFDTAPPGFFDNMKRTPEGLVSSGSYYDALLRFQPMFPSTLLMTRSFFDRIGGYKGELGRVLSEDWEFMLRCVQQAPIGALPDPVVGIRKHASNASGSSYRTTRGEIQILRYALAHHDLSQRSRDLIAEEIVLRTIEAGVEAFTESNFKDCVELLTTVPREQLPLKEKVKLLISSCPVPVAKSLRKMVSSVHADGVS